DAWAAANPRQATHAAIESAFMPHIQRACWNKGMMAVRAAVVPGDYPCRNTPAGRLLIQRVAAQPQGGTTMNFRKLASLAVLAGASGAYAQAPVPQYGRNVNLEQARKAAAAAEADARSKGWPMAIAVVDTAGQMVYFVRMDNTQTGSIQVAQDKAVSAAMY